MRDIGYASDSKHTPGSGRNILEFARPRTVEANGYLARAALALANEYGGLETQDAVRTKIDDKQLTDVFYGIRDRLDRGTGIDGTTRFLLSVPGVYAKAVDAALHAHGNRKLTQEDSTALIDKILRQLREDARRALARALVADVTASAGIAISADLGAAAVEKLYEGDLVTRDRQSLEDFLRLMIKGIRDQGNLPAALTAYIAKHDIDVNRFTPKVQASVISYLQKIGAPTQMDLAKVAAGDFDEFFVLAYNQALRTTNEDGGADPIDAFRQKGSVAEWDFTVDAFESIDEQGIIRENILAAGALDYVYTLGERLGIFKLADAVVLRWASGQIDLQPGETAGKLYRYWKLRAERMQADERAMLYKRVLNRGEGSLLDGMVPNEAFPELWGSLMERMADYISRVEEKKTEEYSVSRQPIYQATKQLQYNLTEFMTGMAHMQVTEMYHQLQEAKSILEDPQIVDFFGNGRRRTLWTVIERGHKEWFSEAPNIAAIRTLAVDGNRVFQWIAAFDQSNVTDAAFDAAREAAESWIIAQADGGPDGDREAVPAGSAPSSNGSSPAGDGFDSDWNK
jgi:hypothetical protein